MTEYQDLTIKRFNGENAARYLKEIGDLRIEIFRDYPYLYEGSHDYETKYLGRYLQSTLSLFVLVFAPDGQLVGCSTGMPLDQEMGEIQKPFQNAGLDISEIFYFGESILKNDWRGRGIGHLFFDEREKFARALSRFQHTTFCAVEREEAHPLKPEGYRPLDEFWEKRGYTRQPFRTKIAWPDLGETEDSEKWMVFWMKTL